MRLGNASDWITAGKAMNFGLDEVQNTVRGGTIQEIKKKQTKAYATAVLNLMNGPDKVTANSLMQLAEKFELDPVEASGVLDVIMGFKEKMAENKRKKQQRSVMDTMEIGEGGPTKKQGMEAFIRGGVTFPKHLMEEELTDYERYKQKLDIAYSEGRITKLQRDEGERKLKAQRAATTFETSQKIRENKIEKYENEVAGRPDAAAAATKKAEREEEKFGMAKTRERRTLSKNIESAVGRLMDDKFTVPSNERAMRIAAVNSRAYELATDDKNPMPYIKAVEKSFGEFVQKGLVSETPGFKKGMVYGDNIEQIAAHVKKMVAAKMPPEKIVSILIKNGVQKEAAVKLVQKFAAPQARGIPTSQPASVLDNTTEGSWRKFAPKF